MAADKQINHCVRRAQAVKTTNPTNCTLNCQPNRLIKISWGLGMILFKLPDWFNFDISNMCYKWVWVGPILVAYGTQPNRNFGSSSQVLLVGPVGASHKSWGPLVAVKLMKQWTLWYMYGCWKDWRGPVARQSLTIWSLCHTLMGYSRICRFFFIVDALSCV